MKLFPPFYRTIVTVTDKNKFLNNLIEITDTNQAITNRRFKGLISEFHFLIERNTNQVNTNKPQIKGRFINGNKVIIEIVSKKYIPLIIFGMGFLINTIGFQKNWELTTLISLIVMLLLYIGFWALHLFEFKKTKNEVEFIVSMFQ